MYNIGPNIVSRTNQPTDSNIAVFHANGEQYPTKKKWNPKWFEACVCQRCCLLLCEIPSFGMRIMYISTVTDTQWSDTHSHTHTHRVKLSTQCELVILKRCSRTLYSNVVHINELRICLSTTPRTSMGVRVSVCVWTSFPLIAYHKSGKLDWEQEIPVVSTTYTSLA